jgi:hypothetical protein
MSDSREVSFEFPSIEHPALLQVLLEEAKRRAVPIHRVSMGGGIRMLTNTERDDMLSQAHGHGIDVYSFISSRNSFETLVDKGAGEQLRGEVAFDDAIEELHRCCEWGVDGVLLADLGLLDAANKLRMSGDLHGLAFKTSVAIAPMNAAAAALYERLGATSINVSGSSTIDDLAAMRSRLASSTSLDIYIEISADLSGGLRYRDAAALVEAAAPVHLKFGLLNAPTLYPYGAHLEPIARQVTREKVRRAELVSENLVRVGVYLNGREA